MAVPPTKKEIFPRKFHLLIQARLKEIPGLVLFVAALWLGLWLRTTVQDGLLVPCSEEAEGVSAFFSWGAYRLRLGFGWGAWAVPLVLFLWGLQFLQHRPQALFPLLALGLCPLCLSIFCQGLFMDQVVFLDPASPTGLLLKGGTVGLAALQWGTQSLKQANVMWLLWPILLLIFGVFLLSVKALLKTSWKEVHEKLKRLGSLVKKIVWRLTPKSPRRSKRLDPESIPSVGEKSTKESVQSKPAQAYKAGELFDLPENPQGYRLPSVDLLAPVRDAGGAVLSKEKLVELSQQLMTVLQEFGIYGEIIDAQPGPIVTMFEFRPAPGIKTARVMSLADDIARSMSALSARIANIPGKNAIGIEIPNAKRQTVYLRSLLTCSLYKQTTLQLPLILGKDIFGHPVLADLAKMPHLLVAGTTGSGKSVSINTMILSILFKFPPETCRFIMIDPKMLELSVYNDIPHLLTPVVTDPKKAVYALKWAVREMESRYKAMSRLGVRNIDGFNQRIRENQKKGTPFTQSIQTGFDPATGKPLFENKILDYKPLPFIVVVVDEMADLMLVAGKDIEMAVQRLAQMARAAGIHLIMATQRPSVDVITGTIKANFPTRISFQVTSKIDSRTILGEQGAEHLLGHGDMLYMSGGGRIQRVHGPFASDEDVEAVATFLKSQGQPDYVDGVTDDDGMGEVASGGNESDDLFAQAVDLVRREGRVSISYIQRNFQIGYNKAAKLVEQMEKQGIVSTPDRTGKRELLD